MAVLLSVVSGVLVAIAAQTGQTVVKEAPKEGDIPYGKDVLVDDGTCPKGEVKEVTGGSSAKAIPRKTRCVKRPARAE